MSSSRFSLFEGLALLLILSTVGALAFPVRQQMSEAAALAKCRSNLHELGSAVHLYASENAGRVPGNYNVDGSPSALEGTYIGDGRMYGALVTPQFGGYGEQDYTGTVHSLICPSFPAEIFDAYPDYKRPEEISETNPIVRTGYIWIYRPYSAGPASTRIRANDTIHGNPHNPLVFDLRPHNMAGAAGPSLLPSSHAEVMNVLHLGGHVTSFPLEQTKQYTSWNTLYDALRENSASNE
jgi:hypothetical protein